MKSTQRASARGVILRAIGRRTLRSSGPGLAVLAPSAERSVGRLRRQSRMTKRSEFMPPTHDAQSERPGMRRRDVIRLLASHPHQCRVSPIQVEPAVEPHGFKITRVAAVPAFFPCHSAASNALLMSLSGKLWETSEDSGYFAFVRTRNSSAAGMIQGS